MFHIEPKMSQQNSLYRFRSTVTKYMAHYWIPTCTEFIYLSVAKS